MMLAALLTVASTAAAASCDAAAPLAKLDAQLDAAEGAFLAMDLEGFLAEHAALEAIVPCLEAVLDPPRAARLHTIEASAAFLDRDEQRTVSAFQAADRATPGAPLTGWLPDRHPVSTELRYARRLDPPPAAPLAVAAGTVWVDGHPAEVLTLSWPAVMQHTSPDGALQETILYRPSTPLPGWVVLAPEPMSPGLRRRLVLGSATVASAASAAVLLAVSADSYARFSGDIPYGEMDAVQTRANVSAGLGIGAAALTAGLGATLFISW